ncbi:MAG: radical SAM protein [Candidatus Omnitrophota bacterium]|nr:radical SAM protein [Candidatus Omnitrophota bacterium]
MRKFKYIYGPVYSWRLGRSLGVDPISQKDKTCSFDCSYCQLGKTGDLVSERKIYIQSKAILEEISSIPKSEKIDYIALSGSGEPTLAQNLGEIIRGIRRIRKEKIAVITNAALINSSDVRDDLALADFVLVKLDANAEDLFRSINNPAEGIRFGDVVKGIKKFKETYKGRLALQVMLIEKNKQYASEIAKMAVKLGIKEVQLNTPTRLCPEKALTRPEMDILKKHFKGMKINYVYDAKTRLVTAMDKEEAERRHGKYKQ